MSGFFFGGAEGSVSSGGDALFDADEEMIYQGYLSKQGQVNTAWKRRFFVLTNKSLYYFSKQPSCYSTKTVRGAINLIYVTAVTQNTAEEDDQAAGTLFNIQTPFRTYYLRVDEGSQQDRLQTAVAWITNIGAATERQVSTFAGDTSGRDAYSNFRTIARQGRRLLSMALSTKTVAMLPAPLKRLAIEARTYVFGEKAFERDSPAWIRTTNWLDTFQPCGRAWKQMSRSAANDRRSFAENAVEMLVEVGVDAETKEQIEKDLPRTFTTIEYFADPDVMNSTQRVLTAVAVQLPNVSYVQGMNFIVSYLFLHVKTEQDCFSLFMDMLLHPRYNLQTIFCEGLPNLTVYALLVARMVKEIDPDLFAHLESLGLTDFFFTYQWILTLFTYSMPFDEVAKVWYVSIRLRYYKSDRAYGYIFEGPYSSSTVGMLCLRHFFY